MLYKIKRGKPWELIAGRPIETKKSYHEAQHPAKKIRIEYGYIDEESDSKEQLNGNDTIVYMDGSKIEGKVGAAVSVWRDGREICAEKVKLENFYIVFQGELYALHRATKKCKNLERLQVRTGNYYRS